jgi:hypothetical protein
MLMTELAHECDARMWKAITISLSPRLELTAITVALPPTQLAIFRESDLAG